MLTPLQQAAATTDRSALLIGPAGSGKTTALQERLRRLLAAGEPAYTILILVADPDQRGRYERFIQSQGIPWADLRLAHFSQLGREMVQLFWPLVARPAGFAGGFRPPTFLGYDLAQLLMWRIVAPQLEQGAFAELRRRPQQIVSQLLDTLSRAAFNALTISEATERQSRTWVGEPDHLRHLAQAEEIAHQFRAHCLSHNLLDLSLTVETFLHHVVKHPEFSRYFGERFRHVLIDNMEEQTVAGQQFIGRLLQTSATVIMAYDSDGGYRRFLAADPHGSRRLAGSANRLFELPPLRGPASPLTELGRLLTDTLNGHNEKISAESRQNVRSALLDPVRTRYRREMVVAVARRLGELVHRDGVPPRDIAIIVPYLDGALRYTLTRALKEVGVPVNLVQRRASPREEPRVRAWITWLALAHPAWDVIPTRYDVAEALSLSIAALDPGRAALLAAHLYPHGATTLLPAEHLSADLAARIGPEPLLLYEKLRIWLSEHGGQVAVDRFLYQLFTDLLATRPFQPEPDLAAATVCDWLVRIARRLLESADALGLPGHAAIGHAFVTAINQGLVTSDPPEMGDPPDPDGIVISSIYSYLLGGDPVRVQVWLETAAGGWWDIPRQPLSNVFVLQPDRQPDALWTLADDIAIRNELLTRIIHGLTARCKQSILLATSDLDRRGQRQDGPLWRAFETLQLTFPDFVLP
jgi:hypothetical protein